MTKRIQTRERIIDLLSPHQGQTHYQYQSHSILAPGALDASQNLPVRYDSSAHHFYVEGLHSVTCRSVQEAMGLVEQGVGRRRCAAHELNERSSRSHAVVSVSIGGGKLTFVDLAGKA